MADFTKIRIAKSGIPAQEDVREFPIYSIMEAAFFLGIPRTTLTYWTKAHDFPRLGHVEPFIKAAGAQRDLFTGKDEALLSFYNLSEAHILSVITRFHGIKMNRVRGALNELQELGLSNQSHPLLSREFYTDGRDIFTKTIEKRKKFTINLSQYGQLGLRQVLDLYLEKVERDADFNPIKLFPEKQSAKVVSIIPTVSSGRPIVDANGVPVATIWNRFKAGDTVPHIADDYAMDEAQVRGALDYCEQRAA